GSADIDDAFNWSLDPVFWVGTSHTGRFEQRAASGSPVSGEPASVPSDDPFFMVAGTSIQGSYIPTSSSGSITDTSTPGSVAAVTAGGITINLIFDAAAMAAPASFRAGIQQAVAILAANI